MIKFLQASTRRWITRNPRDVAPWISVFPKIDPRRTPSWYREHGFRDESDIALNKLDRDELGWAAFRNLTTAAMKMQTVLHAENPI